MLAVYTLYDALARNWALLGIGITIILLVGVPGFFLRKYVNICLKIFDTIPPLFYGPKQHGAMGGEPVDFRALDGHPLRGLLIPGNPDQPARGLIIFAHEFLSDRTSAHRYCAALIQAGYEILAFDFRGHGESPDEQGYRPSQWSSDREHSDMMGAIAFAEDYLERHERPPTLGILGISRGACAAVLTAADVPQVKAVVADGLFSSDTALEFFMKKWACIFAKLRIVYENHPPTVWRFLRWRVFCKAGRRYGCRFLSVRKIVGQLPGTALLFIHGERDSYIPVWQAQRLFELAKGPKYFWLAPKAKHNDSVAVHPAEYGDKIVRFFNEHVANVRAPIPALTPGLLEPLSDRTAEDRTGVPGVPGRTSPMPLARDP